MINISHLKKTFKSRNHQVVNAIDDVSFNLADKGFVFVVGKSGSGKTTLLSLIGGLDKFDDGKIIVDGQNLSHLKGRKFDYYRNESVGFIFQDFQLFDDLTVYENIKLGLDFKNDRDYSKIKDVLNSVDLPGFENRIVKDLSGGEKQRVAIARVLVKNPKIILADEPTGNLDNETTKKVLSILKNIAKDRLVLIVSHNIYDAHLFADYILELQDGKLIGTYKRNDTLKKSIQLNNGILHLPLHNEIIEEEKEEILANLEYGVKKIVQDDNDFSPCDLTNEQNIISKDITRKHISFSNAFKLGIHFIKNNMLNMFVFSFITASLFSLINASNSIREISYDSIINNHIDQYEDDYVFMIKDHDMKSRAMLHYEVEEETYKKLSDSGYKGKIYKSYLSLIGSDKKYAKFLSPQTTGILQVDEQYLLDRFDKLEFVAKLEEEKPYGFYICDYLIDFANTFIPSSKKSYKDCLGSKYSYQNNVYINGIIKTNYQEKYKPFLPYLFDRDVINDDIIMTLINIDKNLYTELIKDMNYYFYNLFTFNSNFQKEMMDSNLNITGERYGNFDYQGKNFTSRNEVIHIYKDESISAISANVYKKLTGKTVYFENKNTIKIDPITITFNLKINENKNGATYIPYDLTFEYVTTPTKEDYEPNIYINTNDESLTDLASRLFFINNGFILDNSADLKTLNEAGCFNDNLIIYDNCINTAESGDRLNTVFNKIFTLIILSLLICCAISLIFYGVYLVKSNMKMIGICKSLGSRTIDILSILSLNLLFSILLTAAFYSGLAYVFLYIIDKILLNAVVTTSLSPSCLTIKLLFNNYYFYIGNIIIIMVLAVVSFLSLFFKINRLKPIELIKSNR